VAAVLHAARDDIAHAWQRAVITQLPVLLRHERALVLELLPVLFDGLGAWVHGDDRPPRRPPHAFPSRPPPSRQTPARPARPGAPPGSRRPRPSPPR